jgi:predicted lipoprotein with Yx(FWY)xxD motif
VRYRLRSILALTSIPVLAIALGACGSSNNSSSSSSTPATNTAATNGETVSVQSVGGVGSVLVDSQGNTLYTNAQDSGSKVACTGQCTSIWPPLAAPSSGQPTSSDSSVQAKLGVVQLPDGSSQVTYGGKPLYTFVQDSPGKATGNGVTDSFGGTSFTWTAASSTGGTATGGASAGGTSSGTTTSSSSGGSSSSSGGSSSGGGGYGY